jgi:hypothetical protein
MVAQDGHLLVGSVVLCSLAVHRLLAAVLRQQAVQRDGGVVGTENLDRQPLHQLLEPHVEVLGIKALEQLVTLLLGCWEGGRRVCEGVRGQAAAWQCWVATGGAHSGRTGD